MPPQQENGDNWKRNFNFTHSLFLMHQRALTVPMRHHYGVQALGAPCAFALVLMVAWAVLTRDPYMWWWIGAWLICQLLRRWESVRLHRRGARIHTMYDGFPIGAIRLGKTEKTAKMVVEPLMFGLAGWGLYAMYQDYGWPVHGLPYFFMAGAVTLPFVEMVKQTAWEKRLQAMNDARIEQEMAVQDYRDQYGDF